MSTKRVARGAMAWRLFRGGLWEARRAIGAVAAVAAGWALLSWGAWLALSAAGVGADWGAAKAVVTSAGAVAELFLAICLPLGASVEDMDDHGRWSPMDEGPSPPRPPDPMVVWTAALIGACIVGLDAGRALSPHISWAPSWLCWAASSWWLLIDAVSAALIAAVLGGIASVGSVEIWRSSTRLHLPEWTRAEREEIGSAIRQGCPGGGRRRL